MIKLKKWIPVLFCSLPPNATWAWTEHGRMLDLVLQNVKTDPQWQPLLDLNAPIEPLENFLCDTIAAMPQSLANIEAWSILNEPSYKPAPQNLKYDPRSCDNTLTMQFEQAIRINADPANLNSINLNLSPLTGQQILTLFVDEPDNGQDTNLYDDNPKHFSYGFGTQPIGVANIPYVSQFLFHVGTYQEGWLIKFLSPRIKESYPAYRAHLFYELSKFAQNTGNHPYWALRFAAWSLHYIEDLTQPYHSKLFPDYTVAQMIYFFIEKSFGKPQDYQNAVQIIANRHTIVENMLDSIIVNKLDITGDLQTALQKNFINRKDIKCSNVSDLIRNKISKETASEALHFVNQFVNQFVNNMDSHYFTNPDTQFDVSQLKQSDYVALFSNLSVEAKKDITSAYAQRLNFFSLYSQICLADMFSIRSSRL